MKVIKAIFDTNLWISFLISNKLSFIDQLLYDGKLKLIFSDELIDEFISVTKRPKFAKIFRENDVASLLELFSSYGEIVQVYTKVDLCRDKNDNFLLNLAIDSQADFLITGDHDLLDLKFVSNTKIITMNEFRDFFKQIYES